MSDGRRPDGRATDGGPPRGAPASHRAPSLRGAARTPCRAAGFTLIEVVLALAVMLLLLGVTVIQFSGWIEDTELEEGVQRFEATLRMCRAEAANRGRRFQLVFTRPEGKRRAAEGAVANVMWEAKPLAAPGRFTRFAAASWPRQMPDELVRVVRCEVSNLQGGEPWRDEQQDESGDRLDPVTFYPDGSSDSARIELASQRKTQRRQAVLDMDGLTAIVTTRFYDSSRSSAEDAAAGGGRGSARR